MSTPTAVSISLSSLTNATVTFSDGSTHTFGPNPVLDLAAGVQATVPIQMLHDALVAREAEFQAQIATQTTTASTAVAATTTLQGNVDRIVEAAIALNSTDPAIQALVTEASALSSTSRKAAAQAVVDKAAANLASAQAALATHS